MNCEGKKFLFVIDALNGLSDRRDLRWFPRMLPKHIHFVISTLPGEVNDACRKSRLVSRERNAVGATTAELIFTSYLALFNKTLPDELVKQVMAHKLSVNPLFLLTLAEELRLFGEHEQLSNRLDHYLTSITVDDLFERVLERIEQDYGADTLREIMTALWAARCRTARGGDPWLLRSQANALGLYTQRVRSDTYRCIRSLDICT